MRSILLTLAALTLPLTGAAAEKQWEVLIGQTPPDSIVAAEGAVAIMARSPALILWFNDRGRELYRRSRNEEHEILNVTRRALTLCVHEIGGDSSLVEVGRDGKEVVYHRAGEEYVNFDQRQAHMKVSDKNGFYVCRRDSSGNVFLSRFKYHRFSLFR